MKKKRKFGRKLLSFLLTLALVLGLMPGMGLTAYAATDTYTALKNNASVVQFNGYNWYIIEDNSTAVDAGTVTLLAAESLGTSKFHDSSNAYSTSTIRTTLENMTASGGSFAGVASAINTVSVKGSESDTAVESKLWLLSVDEASNVPENVRKLSAIWWLRSPGSFGSKAAFVEGGSGDVNVLGSLVFDGLGVRPALKLDLSSVIFESGTNTFTVGSAASEPENIIISPASGDIAEALAAAEEGKTVGDITINLTEGVTYTISNTIVAPASLTINGNGAIIDAGNLNAPMIALANIENPTQWTELNIAVSGLYVNGLKKQMFYSACKNYLCKTFTVDNCVVEVAADVITFDFTKGSVAESFVISNSTFYAPTATTKSLYSSQGGQKLTEYNGDTTQSFKLTHNTFFNLASTKNFFVHRQNNQKWLSYEAKGNVFANCGKSGQVIIGLNGSGISANPTWDIDGNLFNYDGADTSATETTGDNNEPVKNSVAGVVTFVAPASGNFNGTLELSGGATLPEKLGDPRFTLSSHTHNFTYSVSGATITATCNADGCDLPPSTEGGSDHVATLIIGAPTLTTYGQTGDGISASATLNGLDNFKTATGLNVQTSSIVYWNAKIQEGVYKTDGDQPLTAAPTSVGNYLAKITVNNCIASVGYTIAKADPTAAAPSATATYGQTLADVTLTNPTGNTAGTWAWAVATTTSVGDVGSNKFKANFTPTDTTNYNSKNNVDVTVTVGKADNPATVTGTASATAGGNTVDLADNVTLNGATGDVSYVISGEANGCSMNGSVLTSGSTAGTVTVNVTVATDANYNALAATPITVTISEKQTQTITADDVTVTYGDTGKSITATTDGDGDLSFAVKSGDAVTVNATTGALTIVKAGSAVITVTAAETATYAQATKDVNITVNQVNSSGEVTAVSGLVYDGTAKALVDSKVHGGIFMYRLGTDGEWTEDIPVAVAFDTYTVYYYIKGDGNHKDNGSETEPMGSVDVTIKCPYSNEWVDGKWYNKDGSQTYKPLGSWKKDGKDWMYADSSGWYAKNRWQKIDFKWYFFDKEGHMLKDAYQKDASGKIWYLGKNGAWDEKAAVIGWKQDAKGWWFGLYGNDYLKDTWKKINGNWYYFKSTGYIAVNEFVQGWWVNKNGVQSDPVKYSWHKSGSKYWYGTKDGWYAKGKSYTIDGKKYTFDKKGYTK